MHGACRSTLVLVLAHKVVLSVNAEDHLSKLALNEFVVAADPTSAGSLFSGSVFSGQHLAKTSQQLAWWIITNVLR